MHDLYSAKLDALLGAALRVTQQHGNCGNGRPVRAHPWQGPHSCESAQPWLPVPAAEAER